MTTPSGCTLGTNCAQDGLATLNPAIRNLLKLGKVDGVIDLAADPLMGLLSTTSNTNYYDDGTHQQPRGASLFGAIIQQQIELVWP